MSERDTIADELIASSSQRNVMYLQLRGTVIRRGDLENDLAAAPLVCICE
jgi:hypothetical protein